MNLPRKFVTTGVGFTFGVVGSTGIIFQFFFKTHTLLDIHGWIGVAFVAAAVVHIFQNWNGLLKHFQDRRVFLLLIPIVLVIVTIGVASFGGGPNDRREGINPRELFHKLAEASARDLAKVFGKDVNTVVTSMTGDGMHVDGPDETLVQLAQANHKSPEGLLDYFVK